MLKSMRLGQNGRRELLERDFSQIYVFDLGGNIKKRTSKPVYNVFDIQVGVSVNIFVKHRQEND